MSETAPTVPTVTTSPACPTALVSYAHDDDARSVDALAQELRLRGISVIRDTEAFRAGRSLSGEMAEVIDVDLVVAHLGPGALESEAVIEHELGPALRQYSRTGRPIVVLVPHGIGETREEIDTRIAGRLPYSAEATWAPTPEPAATPLTSESAAEVARAALHSLYGPGRGPGDGRWQSLLLTRGTRRHGDGLVVDATELTGGDARRPGDRHAWARVRAAIDDLASTLGAHGSRRAITVTSNAHATGGFLFGLAFNRPAHWELRVAGPDGDCLPSTRRTLDGIRELRIDGSSGDHQLFVGVDLATRSVATGIDRLCAAQGSRPGTQIVFERASNEQDLTAQQISDAAAAISSRIKTTIDERRAERLDVFIAAPSAFAVLLGAEMATIGLPIGLWEHDDTRYVHALDTTHP